MTDIDARPLTGWDAVDVGDDVWCLAWIGLPFRVVGKDEERRVIQLDNAGPVSLPEGAKIDLHPENHFMVTREHWDQLWYWPDIAGEHYQEVVERFVARHDEGQIVNGYTAGIMTVVEDAKRAMAFRLSFAGYHHFGQITAEPCVAVDADGTGIVVAHDPSISAERWLRSGPRLPLELRMVSYRWALTYGKLVLNWPDFD